ncbi:MAG: VCBS repeat-containing protein [Chloroflexi bacterium]|nr:VCBS repeat-containing protein [Ardenticatenaceae bacterium]MBL1131143.1 VCBS repeat-containing protein [Chloroflexota bacterium]NOG37242.1 VCBS repeat-containing protein [Chloroflexota bacterium]
MNTVFIQLYRRCLQLFSPHFRQEFADEMEELFRERLMLAAAHGRLALLLFLVRELAGLLAGGIRQRVYVWRARPLLAVSTGGGITMPRRGGQPWRWAGYLFLVLLPLVMLLAGRHLWYVTLDSTYDVRHVALGDVNGDGRLDAFLSVGSVGDGYWRADRVLWNEGDGRFTDSGQELGEWRSFAAAVGDINNDGYVDILSGSYSGLMVYQNDSSGAFTTTIYAPGDFVHRSSQLNVVLADLDGDGRLDAFTTGCCGWIGQGARYPAYSEVWLNDGAGGLRRSGQHIGQTGSNAVALGDLNGDGIIDAFLANGRTIHDQDNPLPAMARFRQWWRAMAWGLMGQNIYTFNTPNTVWLNDGQGRFMDSGQQLGQSESMAVALGDINDDGFLDAVVGNNGADEVWLNDGQGNFRLGQRLGRGLTWSVYLADLDGDGDLDLVVGGENNGRVWLNDGSGHLRRGQGFGYGRYQSIAVGDVTGDGIVDIFVAGVETYQVWRGVGDGRFTPDP